MRAWQKTEYSFYRIVVYPRKERGKKGRRERRKERSKQRKVCSRLPKGNFRKIIKYKYL